MLHTPGQRRVCLCVRGVLPHPDQEHGSTLPSRRADATAPNPTPAAVGAATGLERGGARPWRPRPPFPAALPDFPEPGGMGAADRPGRLPARLLLLLLRGGGGGGWSAWPVPVEGAAGALDTRPCGNPARGLCVLSNYLFIEKRKGGERKKRSHMSGLYVFKEKQQKKGKK